jgi:hypothetical protein
MVKEGRVKGSPVRVRCWCWGVFSVLTGDKDGGWVEESILLDSIAGIEADGRWERAG